MTYPIAYIWNAIDNYTGFGAAVVRGIMSAVLVPIIFYPWYAWVLFSFMSYKLGEPWCYFIAAFCVLQYILLVAVAAYFDFRRH